MRVYGKSLKAMVDDEHRVGPLLPGTGGNLG